MCWGFFLIIFKANYYYYYTKLHKVGNEVPASSFLKAFQTQKGVTFNGCRLVCGVTSESPTASQKMRN